MKTLIKIVLLPLAVLLLSLESSAQYYGMQQYQYYQDEDERRTIIHCEEDRIITSGTCRDTITGGSFNLFRTLDYNLEVIEVLTYSMPNAWLLNSGSPGLFFPNSEEEYCWFPYNAGYNYWVELNLELDTISTQPLITNPVNTNEFFALDQMMPTPWTGGYSGLGRMGLLDSAVFLRFDANKQLEYFKTDIIEAFIYESMYTLSRTTDGQLLTSGIVGEYDEDFAPFYLEYDAYVGKFDWDGNLIWQHNFGHPDYFDEQGFVTELPDGNVAFYYCHTDYMGNVDAEYSHRGTLTRVDISSSGEILNTTYYEDSIPRVFLHDIDQRNNRIYVLGEKYGGYYSYTNSFLLVTDLQGNPMSYETYYAENCSDCGNFLLDLDIAPNGDVVMGGYTDLDTLDYNGKKRSWLVKTDCMGRFEPPPLSFSASLLQSGDTLFAISTGEGVFDFSWDFGSGAVDGDTLQYVFAESGEYLVTATGTYCTIDLDTTFTIQIFDCMGNLETPPLSINPTSQELGASTFLFSSTPENLENVFWIIQGDEIFGNEIEYTFSDTGTFVVEVCGEYCDSLMCEEMSVEVYVGLNEIGIGPMELFRVDPNPVSDVLKVDLSHIAKVQEGRLVLRDVTGRLVASCDITSATSFITVDVEPCENGTYLLSLEVGGKTMQTEKIIKQ